MNILYLSQSYLPSRRASGVSVMRMCEAFAALGHDVTLVAKQFDEPSAGADVHAFYGVAPSFEVIRLPRPARRGGELVFAAGVAARVLRARRSADLVYVRDLVGGTLAAELGMATVYEAHGIFEARWQRAAWRRMMRGRRFRGLVAISEAMRRELAAQDLLPTSQPVVVAHSPASVGAPVRPRPAVGAPPRIGYVGSLYPGRGVDLVIELAARLPRCQLELIGGSERDLAYWRARATPPNLAFRGFARPAALPALYREFDVLLMPYPRAGIHGATQQLDTANYCSPMKMFEYMASGVPIVSSDLPVLQEVLSHERNALIAAATDAGAWQHAIERLVADRALAVALATQAAADLVAYTPAARAQRILAGLGIA